MVISKKALVVIGAITLIAAVGFVVGYQTGLPKPKTEKVADLVVHADSMIAQFKATLDNAVLGTKEDTVRVNQAQFLFAYWTGARDAFKSIKAPEVIEQNTVQ